MSFFQWINRVIQRMKWGDVALIKFSVLFFTLFLVKLFPILLTWDWRTYLGLSFIAAIIVILRVYEKTWIKISYVILYAAIYLIAEFLL